MVHRAGVVVAASGLALAALAPATARAQSVREVSRSAPILAAVDGVEAQYQGSFEVVSPPPTVSVFTGAASAATFVFPHTVGHLRAVDTASISGITTRLEDLADVDRFDAADGIPPVIASGCSVHFNGSCRTVFTTVEAPDTGGLVERPDRVLVNTANVDGLKSLLAPALSEADVAILIQRILQGVPDGSGGYRSGLGGIDRSTMAVIEASPLTPLIAGEERPAMIYVGGLDGMLHAICAQVRGACTELGRELWAFIPRTQLGALRSNTQRIDGSPKVADVFDDFNRSDGVVFREFRTVLTFQTGSGDPGTPDRQPSVVAIDITDPSDPVVLWERSTPASRDAVDLGVGLGLAMGPARSGNAVRNLTFAQTNNGGTDASGFYVAAIDTVTGARVWKHEALYPPPRDPLNPSVPDSGIPGGVAGFDLDQAGQVTHLAAASLYGDLWILDAGNGNPSHGTSPIFRFSTDFHPIGAPPTIYSDLTSARLYAVVVSGGYADPVAATWVRPTDNQFAVSVVVDPPGTVPMSEVDSVPLEDRPIVINLGPGRRATGQAVVAGNELFVTTDSTDVNLDSYGETPDTGLLSRFTLNVGTPSPQKGTSVTIAAGGSSVAVAASGAVHVGSGGGAMKTAAAATGGGAFEGIGSAIERSDGGVNQRLLWLIE